jgi:protein SCO1/2
MMIGLLVSPCVDAEAVARDKAVVRQESTRGDDGLAPLLTVLIDQDGRAIDAARLTNYIVLVNFIFTGCGSTCPIQTAALAKFDRSLPPALRARVKLLSISVDPGNDSPAVLKTYARTFGIDTRRWTFATGRPDLIRRITDAFSAMRPGTAGAGFHTSEVRLFDARHRMIQRYAGAPLAEAQLRADVLTLAAMHP